MLNCGNCLNQLFRSCYQALCYLALLLFSSACVSQPQIIEESSKWRGTWYFIESGECKVAVEVDLEDKKFSKAKEVLTVRNKCRSNHKDFLKYANRLIKHIDDEHKIFPYIKSVFLSHWSNDQSQSLSSYASTAPEWLEFVESSEMRGLHDVTLGLIKRSGAMSDFIQLFSQYGVDLNPNSIEKISTATLVTLVEKGVINQPISGYDGVRNVRVPYEGMLWFSRVYD